jgi:hypothetical protein
MIMPVLSGIQMGIAIAVLVLSNLFTYRVTSDIAAAKLTSYKLQVYEAGMILQKQYNDSTRKLQETTDALLQDKNNEIAVISGRLDTTLISLRNRKTRAESTVTQDPCNCEGATGAQLSREDGEFLAREAASAARINSGLTACYAQYDKVKEEFDRLTDEYVKTP